MISKIYSSKLVRPQAISALVMMLLLEGLPSVSALAAEGGAIRYGGNNSSRINIPPDLTDNTPVAAGIPHALAVRHNTTKASLSENFSGQSNASFALAKGRTWHHKDKLNSSISVVKT